MPVKRAASAFLLACALLLVGCGNNRAFDPAAWLKADARERGRMSEHLVKSRLLIGKTAEETQQVLGRADTDYGRGLSYQIDLGWPFKDCEKCGLIVDLDANRTVLGARIVD